MDHGLIPSDLLLAMICPIHKGGSRAEPKQFRPVALTSHIIKVFERVVRQALVKYLEEHSYMAPGQHGFRAMRSTLTQLLTHYEEILEDLNSGDQCGVDTIYLDFSKAFDKVDHGVLLHKLRDLGVKGKVGVWLDAFLRSRYQFVSVNGVKSDKSLVISGVPQGTVLGPILFLVLIADISEGTSSSTRFRSFADDTRGSRAVRSTADLLTLQQDLQVVYDWAERVNMAFNSDKFEAARYWPYKDLAGLKQESSYFNPAGEIIEEKENIKDLGVYLSTDLTFSYHIDVTILSCTKLCGWALRSFRSRSRMVMITIWKSLVQSRLDYCSQLWSPWSAAEINRLEDIQRHFTSKINGMQGQNYWERMKTLRMYSQERRRERYMIIFIWKIANGLVSGYNLDFTAGGRRGVLCSVKDTNQTAPSSVRNARNSCLSVRGAKLFNTMPIEIRSLQDTKVAHFKTLLDNFLQTIPDQPTISSQGRAAATNSLLDQIPMHRQQ